MASCSAREHDDEVEVRARSALSTNDGAGEENHFCLPIPVRLDPLSDFDNVLDHVDLSPRRLLAGLIGAFLQYQ